MRGKAEMLKGGFLQKATEGTERIADLRFEI
jgi:hypothetical protein